jgi:hypothetical protein
MSDPVGYIDLTVVGPDTAAALTWLRRQQAWERHLEELEARPRTPAEAPGEPSTAA